jgi:hypothetical protein
MKAMQAYANRIGLHAPSIRAPALELPRHRDHARYGRSRRDTGAISGPTGLGVPPTTKGAGWLEGLSASGYEPHGSLQGGRQVAEEKNKARYDRVAIVPDH